MDEGLEQLVAVLAGVGARAIIVDSDEVVRATVGVEAHIAGVTVGAALPSQVAGERNDMSGYGIIRVDEGAGRLSALSSLGHELRAPLNAILGMSELLTGSRLDGAQRRQLDLLRRAATGLGDLLDRLLQLERLGSHDDVAASEPFELYDVLEGVLDLFSVRAQRRSTELGVVVDERVPGYLLGDAPRLRQVIANLVGNAVKYTDEGRIVVRVEPAGQEGRLQFSVEDSGLGVSGERRSRLFVPFWQLGRAAGEGGSGLGLAISRGLVELMGGEIWYEPAPSGGSVFRFTVPIEVQTAPKRHTSPSLLGAGDRGVLLLDDRALAVEAAAAVLARHGLRPRAVASIADVAHVFENDPGRDWTVFADINLVRSGTEELIAALSRTTRPVRLVLLLPAAGGADDFTLAERLGAATIFRPLQRRAILDALQRHSEAVPQRPRVTPRRVLVCDDAEDARLFALTVLSAEGHHVDVASGGDEAIAALRDREFDLALIDVEMPGISGVDVVRALTAEERAKVQLVACTAHTEEGVVAQLREAGFHQHLGKPLARASLLAVVSDAALLAPRPANAASTVEGRMALLRRDWDALALFAARALDGDARKLFEDAVRRRDLNDTERALSELERPAGPDAAEQGAVEARLSALVPRFLAQREEDLLELARALDQDDFDRMRFIGHRIAGSSNTYGFPAMGRAGKRLEDAAERQDADGARAGIADLESAIKQTRSV